MKYLLLFHAQFVGVFNSQNDVWRYIKDYSKTERQYFDIIPFEKSQNGDEFMANPK